MTAALAAVVPLSQVAAADASVTGPDVSSYQHPYGYTIDWNGVHSSGAAFAFVKATEGPSYSSTWFKRDWAGLKASGTIRGAYHFARPSATPGSAQAQARHFVAVAGTMSSAGDLPPVLDLEVSGGLRPAALAAWAHTYLSTVAALTHRTPILYTYPGFWSSSMANNRTFSAYPLWLARYSSARPTPVAGWSNWTFWQYTDSGTVKGIKTKVDVSTFNGTFAQLRAMAHLGSSSAPKPNPTPAPTPTGGTGALPVGTWNGLSVVPGGVRVTAWAVDPSATRRTIAVKAYLNGQLVRTITASAWRSDLAAAHPSYGAAHGLDTKILGIRPGTRSLCLVAYGVGGRSKSLGCRSFMQMGDPKVGITFSRSGRQVYAQGWAVDPQTTTPVTVSLSVNGRKVRQTVARATTPLPTGTWASWGPGHGYLLSYAAQGKAKLCVTFANQSYGTSRTACATR